MRSSLRKVATFATLVATCMGANSASPIPDAPVAAIEPGLSIDPRVGVGIGWVDDHTLLVSAMINDKSQFWERRVMRVDAKTGETIEQVNPGYLVCTNPTEGIAGISVGNDDKLYAGKSDQPNPERKLYSWNSRFGGKLSQKTETGNWNIHICKKTLPSHVKVGSQLTFFSDYDIVYLEERDGYLRLQRQNGEQRSVVLTKDDKPVATVQARPNEIAPGPEYLPFRNEYLLSSGQFTLYGTMVRRNEAPVTEHPMLTMTRSGKVKREFFRSIFEDAGLRLHGLTYPYSNGTLIYASNRPQNGGGIYLREGQSVKRIWCTNQGNHYDRKCQLSSLSISPNGCYAAFHEEGPDNPRAPYSYLPTLKILPLCN